MAFVYRIIIYALPFLLSILGYVWLARKAAKLESRPGKFITFFLVGAGLAFTGWELYISLPRMRGDTGFNFEVMLGNIFLLFCLSIVLAFATPEK